MAASKASNYMVSKNKMLESDLSGEKCVIEWRFHYKITLNIAILAVFDVILGIKIDHCG